MTAPLIRLFVSSDLSAEGSIDLSADQAHYLGNVMRRGVGDEVALFNGRDGEWRASLTALSKKGGAASLRRQARPQQAEPDVWLLFAPIKRSPIDMIAEKATELGAAALYPVTTERTVTGRVNDARLRKIAVEAAEQCERLTVPAVHAADKLDRVLSAWPAGRRILFCDEAGDDPDAPWGGRDGRALPVLEALKKAEKTNAWAILTGPEGGFTRDERARLRRLPFVTPATLGPRILRAETAAIAALTLWQAALGDWKGGA